MIKKMLRKTQKNNDAKARMLSALPKREEVKKRLLLANKKMREGSGDAALYSEILGMVKYLEKTAKNSIVKYRKRCSITNRPRGITMFSVSRNYIREHASFGRICGLKKK